MKKLFIVFSVLVLALLIAGPSAFALQCKAGNFESSDECWTNVKVSATETYVVSAGAILVYDITTDSAQRNSFEVVVADASADDHLIAGVAQSIIATGDYGRALVRGKGKLCLGHAGGAGITVATGDRLYVSSSRGKAGTTLATSGSTAVSSSDPIAFALQANSTTPATIDAYITIV